MSNKRFLSPSYVVRKLRQRGLAGAAATINKRFARRMALLGERARWIFPSLSFLAKGAPTGDRRILAIYDFRTMPYTVGELLWFQEFTLVQREECNADKIDIIWVYDPELPARQPRRITRDNQHNHLSALLPLARINPHLGTFMIMDSPAELESYVEDYGFRYAGVAPHFRDWTKMRRADRDWYPELVAFHKTHGSLPRLTCHPAMALWARSFIAREVRPNIPVVVQMRNNLVFGAVRNALTEVWGEFFAACKAKHDLTFIVIGHRHEIVPHFRDIGNVIFAKDFGTNVEEDMALMQESAFFLGSASGPGVMALFSGLPYRILNYKLNRPGFEKIDQGGQFPFSTPHQRLVWEPETVEVLSREFETLLSTIDQEAWVKNFDASTLNAEEKLAGIEG